MFSALSNRRQQRSAQQLAGRSIDFPLQPKQIELLNLINSDVVNVGYGGPRGGGKSRGIRDVMLIRRFAYPRTTGWIVRRTFGEVWDNHIKKYFEERPYTRDWYNTQTKTFTLPNGSEIIARYAENEGDLQREYGKEAMDIFIDQAEQFSEDEHNFLRTCRRSPGVPDGQCKKVDTINPGGKSHGYMKRVYIDREFVDNEIPESFSFIAASGWDNVQWVAEALRNDGFTEIDFYSWSDERRFEYFIHRSQYGRDLNSLPEKDRIQQLLGRWDFFEGQCFPELGAVHNIDNYFDTANESTWREFHSGFRLIGGLDHASTGITTYGMTGTDVDENLLALEEHYKANMLISEHAAAIKQLKSSYSAPEYQVIDPSTEAKTLQNQAEMFSVQDAYRREGLHFISAHRASIAVGIDRLKELLKIDPLHRCPFNQKLGSPRLFISRSRCPNLWREMSQLQLKNGQFIGSDHACDWLRYIAMSRPPAATRKAIDVVKLPTMDQLKIKAEQAFAQKFREKAKGSNSWY